MICILISSLLAQVGAVPVPVQMDQTANIAYSLKEIRADGSEPALFLPHFKQNHPLVLFFFSEQCGVTFSYKDRIQQLLKDFEPVGFKFLGIRGGKRENADAPLKIGETNYLKMTFVDDATGDMVKQFRVGQSLTFAVLDSAGILRYLGGFDDRVSAAQVKRPYLRKALRQIATGKPVTTKSGATLGCSIIPIQ